MGTGNKKPYKLVIGNVLGETSVKVLEEMGSVFSAINKIFFELFIYLIARI